MPALYSATAYVDVYMDILRKGNILGMVYCPTPTLIAGPNVRLNLNFRFY